MEEFRSGGGETMYYTLHSYVGLLELVGDGPENGLEVSRMVSDGGCGFFKPPIRM